MVRESGKQEEELKKVMEAWSRKMTEGCQESGAGSPAVEEDFCWVGCRWVRAGSLGGGNEEAAILYE